MSLPPVRPPHDEFMLYVVQRPVQRALRGLQRAPLPLCTRRWWNALARAFATPAPASASATVDTLAMLANQVSMLTVFADFRLLQQQKLMPAGG